MTNLAARLCAEAQAGQILVSQRVYAAARDVFTARPGRRARSEGASRARAAHNVVGLAAAEAQHERAGPAVLLEDLSEDERERRFARLQARCRRLGGDAARAEGESIVVVPSRDADPHEPGSSVAGVRGAASSSSCFSSASRACGSST